MATNSLQKGVAIMPSEQSEPPLVIGLTGPLGSGVTTTSKVLAKKGFHRVSLSEAIREEYRRRQNIPSGQPIPLAPEIRVALQDLGNEMRGSNSPSYWAEKAMGMAVGIASNQPIVIDSIRNTGEVDG